MPYQYMQRVRRLIASAAMVLLTSCDFLTGPEEIKLDYAPVVLRDQPVAGQVTLGVTVTNAGERKVDVLAGLCSVGYRLKLGLITHEYDPRGCVSGLLIGFGGLLSTGESAQLQGSPPTIASLGPSGTYTLTILVEHAANSGNRYREIAAGEFVIP
jgi:hypothetical protein